MARSGHQERQAMYVEYIKGITERYQRLGYPAYQWYRAETPPPWAPIEKPLAETRLAVLSTAGTYVAGQVAYYYKDDTSIRRIAKDTAVEDLRFSHITENYLGDARADPGCVFPLTALRRLEAEGTIGPLCDELVSSMGGIYSQRRVDAELIPAVEAAFVGQKAEAALLIPL
jgi:D-proline reductase (dithiol) PrdB